MIKFIKSFFKKKEEAVAPYKVETPVAVGEPPATIVVEGVGLVDIAPVAETAPAKKPRNPRKPKTEKATKAMVESIPAPAKKPRAPRKPKAE